MLGGTDQKWASNDGFPYTSPKRTRRWTVGQVYTDARATWQLPADTPPGDYPIEFGVYGGPEGDRLMIWSADGHRSDERLLLGPLIFERPCAFDRLERETKRGRFRVWADQPQ